MQSKSLLETHFFLNETATVLKPTECLYISSTGNKMFCIISTYTWAHGFCCVSVWPGISPNELICPNDLGEGQSPVSWSLCTHNSLSVKQDRCMDLLGINCSHLGMVVTWEPYLKLQDCKQPWQYFGTRHKCSPAESKNSPVIHYLNKVHLELEQTLSMLIKTCLLLRLSTSVLDTLCQSWACCLKCTIKPAHWILIIPNASVSYRYCWNHNFFSVQTISGCWSLLCLAFTHTAKHTAPFGGVKLCVAPL